jgi:large subunit ribosomal protein L24
LLPDRSRRRTGEQPVQEHGVQGTLLGLGIAIILALVAALVGPHFVDWTQYRSVFETQASRLVGLPVRVNGAIDARLLPTPSVVLRDIETGGGDRARIKASEVGLELALGPLMRGEWRATELRLVQPEFAVVLNEAGQVDWPRAAPGIDADALSIERVAIEDGRATLTDRASATSVVLERFWFNGDMRSLAGPYKGEGGFMAGGERYGYRVSTGRQGDDGLKLKFSLDPSDRLLTVEADGMLRFERGSPRFDGALTLARPAGVISARGRALANESWRITARSKLTPGGGLLDQIEAQYGPDERALKLTGTAQVRFGREPRLDGVVSARQLDLDRAYVPPEGTRRLPLAVLRSFADTFGGVLRPQIAVRLGIGVESVTLAGATLQTLRGDVSTDGTAWNLESLDFRAPGLTQVRASGQLAFVTEGVTFAGPAIVESSDPKALLAWIEGRTESAQTQTGTLRASGNLTLGADKIAIERLKADIDRKAVAGRLAYAWPTGGRPARLDAELSAAELDLDQAIVFGRAALAGTTIDAPGEVALAVDIGLATIGGVEAKQAKAKLSFDANGLVFERVAVADLGGAALDLNGRIEALTTAPRGALTLDLDARAFDGIVAVAAKYAPPVADAMRRAAPRLGPAKLSALLTVGEAESGSDRKAELVVTGKAGVARVNLTAQATGDVGRIAAADVGLTGRIYADDGAALIALLGLDTAVIVDKRSASVSVTASGKLGEDVRLDARLAAGRLEAAAAGTVRLYGDEAVSGRLILRTAAADAVVLRRWGGDAPVPITLRTRLDFKNAELAFEEIGGIVAGAGVRGRVALNLGGRPRIEGRLESDALDVTTLLATVVGMPARPGGRGDSAGWPAEPFGPGVLAGLAGQIEFAVSRAQLSAEHVAQEVRGLVRFGEGELSFEDVQGNFAGGRFLAQFALPTGPEGIALRARLALSEADASGVVPGGARPAIAGRLALQAELEGSGLSPATLVGSLRGAGTVTLEAAQIAGLDPKAFDTVIRAVDRGTTVDAAKIRDMMAAALDAGGLALPRLDGAFTIVAGQARWGNVVASGEGGDLAITGTVDLAEWTLDARLTLSGPVGQASVPGRPDVFIGLKGPVAAPKRTLDVSALTGWLTLRTVERQSKQIEALEAERQEAERREAERREVARREAERREAERRETERRETERREAERREAERREAERREAEQQDNQRREERPQSSVGSTPRASAPAGSDPQAGAAAIRLAPPDDKSEARPSGKPAPVAPRRAAVPTEPVESAPPLPPPLEIRPAPEPRGEQSVAPRTPQTPAPNAAAKPKAGGAARPSGDIPPASGRRSVLDYLFGPQR